MNKKTSNKRETFDGRIAIIMALAGSAIGLGNIWRFPYLVGEKGGAAFILVYLFCCVVLSIPVFLSESIIGRRARRNAVGALSSLSPMPNRWKWVGFITLSSPFIILSFYSVVGGWSVWYLIKAITFSFSPSNIDEIAGMFGKFSSSSFMPILCLILFIAFTAGIIFVGVTKGIEKFSKITVPLLFVLMVIIAIYSITLPSANEGIRYLVSPDFSKLTPSTISTALGQSFLSMSLGVGCILTYSSYANSNEDLFRVGVGTAIFDTIFAILAGFAIMPAVFAAGIAPTSGPGLIYEVLPFIFAKMGVGSQLLSGIIAILFFSAILMAALTSSISLMEVGVAYLVEEKGINRHRATLYIFLSAIFIGAICSLSFGPLSEFKIFGNTLFNLFDKLAANYLMTIGSLIFTIFVGWRMNKIDVWEEFTNKGTKPLNVKLFPILKFFIKFVAPILIIFIICLGFFGK